MNSSDPGDADLGKKWNTHDMALAELTLDMRRSWNHVTDKAWGQLDPVLWEVTHNPGLERDREAKRAG